MCNSDQLDIIIMGMQSLDNFDFTYIGPDWTPKDEEKGIKEEPDEDSPRPSTSRKIGCSCLPFKHCNLMDAGVKFFQKYTHKIKKAKAFLGI